MAKKFLTPIDLTKNEIQNVALQRLAAAPSSPVEGQVYYNTTDDKVYVYADGSWTDMTASGGAGSTNLSTTYAATSVTVNSDTGADATIDDADGTNAGVMSASDKTKLDGIESGATADQTAAEIKTAYESNTDTNAYTDADSAKVGYISVTQAVDLDQMESDIAALANGMVYSGNWDASSGSFPSGADTGAFYTVSTAGTVDGVAFAVGDKLVATTDSASTTTYSDNWTKIDSTDEVTSVNGSTGNVVLDADDIDDTSTTNKFVTASDLTKLSNLSGTNTGDEVSATTTTEGIVELATTAETTARTDTSRAVTPSGLASFPRKYSSATVGDGSSTSISITHNLGTKDVVVSVRQNSDDAEVECDVTSTSTTAVTLGFTTAPASNSLTVTVIG